MPEIETDYLVVGAGATGLAFTDALVAASDAEVVLVDRRHRPGGHWLDAYPFVRLHQPSAYYGVASRVLGHDRIDTSGPNAGFYERATAAEICDYFGRVLDEHLLPSGQVRFLGMTDHRGDDADGHHLVSLLAGAPTTVRVRRKIVDATYVASEIPSRRAPAYAVDEGVRLVPPNDLVDLAEPASGFTIIGAGKTAMDTCIWLLDAGVAPDTIRWIRPRDGWFFNRAFTQPLDLVGSYMQLQARWVEAAAHADDAADFADRLEAADVFLRLDPGVRPDVFRGATLSTLEQESLRQVEQVVRFGRVRHIGTRTIRLDGGEIATDPRQVHVDCTAAGVRPTLARPVFDADRITMQYVTPGIAPWSAAIIGHVEATRDADADEEKNALTPPVAFSGEASDLLAFAFASMRSLLARGSQPDVAAWDERCRLNPTCGVAERADDPRVVDALGSLGANLGAAMRNLEDRVTASA